MKKISILFLALFSTIVLRANVINGTCGESLTWSYDTESFALTISGTGDMYDYGESDCPWKAVAPSIVSVTMPNGLTSVGDCAFYDCNSVKTFAIPTTVTKIGRRAFGACSSITTIVIPANVSTIEELAFEGCYQLSTITLSDKLQSIAYGTFWGCENLLSITIPASVIEIGSDALHYSGCKDVFLESTTPATITANTFRSDVVLHVPCNSVTAYQNATIWQFLTIIGNMDYKFKLSAEEGGTARITNSVCAANTVVFEAFPNAGYHFSGWSDGSKDNPRTLLLMADKSITAKFERSTTYFQVNLSGIAYAEGDGYYSDGPSFSGKVLEGTALYIRAISNCGTFTGWSDGVTENSREIRITQDTTITANYTGIETYTVSITAGEHGHLSETKIGEVTTCTNNFTIEAIADEGYHFVEWSDGNTSRWRSFEITSDLVVRAIFAKGEAGGKLGDNLYWAFDKDKQQITISGSGEMTKEGWFFDYDDKHDYSLDRVQKVIIEEGALSVIKNNFNGLHYLETLSLPASMTMIGESSFEDCRSLNKITFAANSNLKTIGDWAFYNCHELAQLVLPEGVETIGKAAFYGCAYLAELSLPSSVRKIADNAFAQCAKMQKMTVNAIIPPTVSDKTFEGVSRSIPVYVPTNSLADYQEAPVWKEFFLVGSGEQEQAIDEISLIQSATKILRDGQIYILREGKMYSVQGQEVK